MAAKKKSSTATGLAILELAAKLKKKNPDLSLSDAKTEAKKRIKESDAFDKKSDKLRDRMLHGSIGQKVKKSILVKLLGDTVGSKIADLTRRSSDEEKSIDAFHAHQNKDDDKDKKKLKQFDKENYKADKLPAKEVKEILDKLNTIEKDVKVIKIAKAEPLAAPAAAARPTRNPHYADAAKALKGLKFQPAEIKTMLETATGNSPEELIKSALTPAHKRIPPKEVPAAIEAVKKDVEPTTAEAPKADLTVKERVENADKLAVATDSTSKQEEASTAKKQEADADTKKQEKEHRSKVMSALDKIEKKLSLKGGLLDLLLIGIGFLIGKYWKQISAAWKKIEPVLEFIWKALKPVIEWIWDGLKTVIGKVWDGLESLVKFLHIDSKVAEMIAPDENKRSLEHQKELGTPTSEAEAIKMGKDSYMDPQDSNKFRIIPKEKRVGPAYTEPKAIPNLAPKTSDNSIEKANIIDAASTDNESMKADAATPVINQNINQDNRVINPPSQQSGGDSSPMFVNVRNPEGSSASYIAELFNHPAKYLDV